MTKLKIDLSLPTEVSSIQQPELKEMVEYLGTLTENDTLTAWEEGFIGDIQDWEGAYTERQEEQIKRLYEKFSFDQWKRRLD